MSDTYRELLVKREPQPSDKLLKAGLIVLTVLAAAAVVLITPWAAVVLLGLCLFNYFKFPSFRLEFEYLYVNGELDVDKIMSRSTRKRAGSYDMEKMELIARWDSHGLLQEWTKRKSNGFFIRKERCRYLCHGIWE
jgi:hypothetical protein